MFFFLYLLIFILCARDNRSNDVLEVVSGDPVSPNYWYHSKYGIPGYARNNWHRAYQFRYKVSKLMVFVQDSSALNEEEDVQSTHQDEEDNKKVQIYSKVKTNDFWSLLIKVEPSRLNDAQI